MKYNVTIPNWSEGKPLVVTWVEAESEAAAEAAVIARINQYAGFAYCTTLPQGTVVEVCQ